MSHIFPYQFQPQPPSHPKTTGGKKGSSAPISIQPLVSDEDDSDESITDHTPPAQNRIPALDFLPGNTGAKTTTNSLILLTTATSPRGNLNAKKPGISLPSPRTINNNNNNGILNLNHAGQPSRQSYSTTTPILILNSNHTNTGFSIVSSTTLNTVLSTNANNDNNSKTSAPSLISSGNHVIHAQNPTTKDGSVSITSATSNISNINISLATTASDSNTTKSSPQPDEPVSPKDRSSSPFSNFAYEHDHDYDNIASPSSSTSSGPIYVRPPGFKHHAQEIVAHSVRSNLKKKKCSATLVSVREGFKKREATPPKLKPKREPLPMKLRALPQSFWQQPNIAHQVSPSTLFPVLPPLAYKESEEAMMDVRPVTPPDERDAFKKTPAAPERKLIVANTDLLMKLFEGVSEEKTKPHAVGKTRNQPKVRKMVPKSNTKGLFLGNDPYMVEAVTEKIFPQLNLEGGSRHSGGGNTSLQLITFKEGDRTVTLPSLSLDQNYPQMLSELVMHI
ncbi:unnamed protein product [Lymnaea stagnalis]|uniref:Uncharacterized protein n=1 Tax=Lymnaea stagnalis TaxID=6523 RepID=A0AAV2IFT7_LYMST